jgi:hypothetical protein
MMGLEPTTFCKGKDSAPDDTKRQTPTIGLIPRK